eukprot:gene4760-5220_t
MKFSSAKLGLNRNSTNKGLGVSQSCSKVVPSSVAGTALGPTASKKSQVQPIEELRNPSLA